MKIDGDVVMMPRSDRWGRALLVAAAFLFCSALVLVVSAALPVPAGGESGGAPVSWTGASLRAVEGEGKVEGTALVLVRLSRARQAMAVADPVALQADEYPYLSYRIRGLAPGTDGVFFWRSGDAPSGFHSVPLRRMAGSKGTLRLADDAGWGGGISAFGIGLVRDLPEPVAIEALEFRPSSLQSELSTIWTDWTAFRDWGQQSINFNTGSASDPRLRPVVAVVVWIGGGLLLFGAVALARRRRPRWQVAVSMFLCGWLILDGLWLVTLWQRSEATYGRFWGKSLQARHEASEWGDVFRLAKAVKNRMPEEPQRLFVVTASRGDDDRWLSRRLYYHLLPHNVFVWNNLPPTAKQAGEGDYVLWLHANESVVFDREKQVLVSAAGKLPVTGPIDRSASASLFRVAAPFVGGNTEQ